MATVLVQLQRRCFNVLASLPLEAYMPCAKLIDHDGYKVEEHQVITPDSYVLTLFRIKGRKVDLSSSPKPASPGHPILIQHGLMSSSDDWIVRRPPEGNLGYLLSDQGFDVWLGNTRGNRYSTHIKFNDPYNNLKHKESFWNFSLHEMGIYDLPAMIDGILEKTGRSKLSYIGHSAGCAVFFIALIQNPELNNVVREMIGLAPAAVVSHSKSPLKPIVKFFGLSKIQKLLSRISGGGHHVIPRKWDIYFKQKGGARIMSTKERFGRVMALVDGSNPGQANDETVGTLLGHSPSDTSVKTLLHFFQQWITDNKPESHHHFAQFDYGEERNLAKYGQAKEPLYDLAKVSCPVHIFYGLNDKLISPEDVTKTATCLGNLQNIEAITHPKWNHIDFLYGKDAPKLVYNKCLEILKE